MKQLAIIGPTASGKSDLAIKIAIKIDAYILSIDSLSIYKEIDIVSAKPSKDELATVKHFGIDELYPDEYFSVDIFIKLYNNVVLECKRDNKNLIIVGGTSFYLKSLISGLSTPPEISLEVKNSAEKKLENLQSAYELLKSIDSNYMKNIMPNDRYRIEKAMLIFLASNTTPTEWFKQNPPKPIIEEFKRYNLTQEDSKLYNEVKALIKKFKFKDAMEIL